MQLGLHVGLGQLKLLCVSGNTPLIQLSCLASAGIAAPSYGVMCQGGRDRVSSTLSAERGGREGWREGDQGGDRDQSVK